MSSGEFEEVLAWHGVISNDDMFRMCGWKVCHTPAKSKEEDTKERHDDAMKAVINMF